MWRQGPAGLVRTMKQWPGSLGRGWQRSLAVLRRAERDDPAEVRGRVVPITGPAIGRAAAAGSVAAALTPVRLLPRHAKAGRFARGVTVFGTLLVVALAAGLVDWTVQAFRNASIGGLVLSPILMVALLSAAGWFWREIRAWRRLARVEELQWDLSRPCESAADDERFRTALAALRATAREPQLAGFIDSADMTADVAVLRSALDRVGLQPMDGKAADAIRAGARDVFFLSLVSTSSMIEVLVFSIRALGVIRRVATAYGCRPGGFGVLRLARHIFTDIALLPVGMLVALEAGREAGSAIRHVAHGAQAAASVAHPLAGVAVGALGHAVGVVAEGVTPRVAEATLAAGRMAHFGLLAAAIVRPVAFSEGGYRDMRNGIYRQILGLRREVVSARKRDGAALANGPGA